MSMDKSISVVRTEPSNPMEFKVIVSTHGTTTEHIVTMSDGHCERLASGRYDPVQLIEASFLFLLDREPKEAILRRFDVADIDRYFPEFESQLPRYLSGLDQSGEAPERGMSGA